jgi:hypothetical protein
VAAAPFEQSLPFRLPPAYSFMESWREKVTEQADEERRAVGGDSALVLERGRDESLAPAPLGACLFVGGV